MDTDSFSEREGAMRERLIAAIARSAELADEHARLADKFGNHPRAELERSRAAEARALVSQMRLPPRPANAERR